MMGVCGRTPRGSRCAAPSSGGYPRQARRRAGRARGAEAVYRIRAPRRPNYTAAKLLWLRGDQPELYRRTVQVLRPRISGYRLTAAWPPTIRRSGPTCSICVPRWSATIWSAGLPADLLPPGCLAHGGGEDAGRGEATGCARARRWSLAARRRLRPGRGGGQPAEPKLYRSSSWISFVARSHLRSAQATLPLPPGPEYLFPGTMQCAGGSYDWWRVLRAWRRASLWRAGRLAGAGSRGRGGALFCPT